MMNLIGRFQIKKIMVCLLVLVMLSSPGLSVLAAPSGSEGGTSSSSYQAELMQLLEQEYGVDQAPAVLATLKQLGLVDSSGELVTVPIYVNGQSYTLDEVMQLIADENTDLTQIAEVDGRQISLSDLKKMIEIEASIAEMTQNNDLADPTITSDHLDSLESLFTQAGSEGFGFYDEAGNLLGDTVTTSTYARSLNASAGNNELAEAEAYKDATYIAVTNYEINTASNPVITFELHRAQNDPGTAPISFDYGFIAGTLGSVATSDYVGTVTFNPSDPTTQTIELQTSSDFNAPCYPFKRLYYSDCADTNSPQKQRQYAQEGYARADYIHFYNFKNLDFINLDKIDSDSFTSFQQFHHTYNGGAYLAFASRMLSDEGVSLANDFNIGDWNYPDRAYKPPFLVFTLTSSGFSGSSTRRYIHEVIAPGGSYTTGQMLPIQVTFNDPVMTVPAGGLDGETARVDLQNGLVASPAIIVPSTPNWSGWGAVSYKLDYQTVLDRSTIEAYQQSIKDQTTYTGLYPDWIQAGDNARKYWRDGDDSTQFTPEYFNRPYYSNNFNVSYDAKADDWEKDYTNAPAIELNYAHSDAFASITLDKPNYGLGDTVTATIHLNNEDGEADWLIDGATTPEELAKRVMVSIGDRSVGVMELDWKKDDQGFALDPPVLEAKLQVTDAIYAMLHDGNSNDGKQLRVKIYYNRNMEPGGLTTNFDSADLGMLVNTYAYTTVTLPTYITQLQIKSPDTWPSGTANVVNLVDQTATHLGFTYDPANATYTSADQFVWSSSDDSIASITPNGDIIPKMPGQVTFTLTARNNDMSPVSVTSDPITISDDGSAAVVVPSSANYIFVTKDKAANVIWTTNVMNRYKELASPGGTAADANFKLELYDGFFDAKDLATQTPSHTWGAPADTGLINATNYSIDGSYITQISTGNTPSYTVRISTPNPENINSTLSAVAYIVVRAEPAIVTLDKSMGQFVTDQVGHVPLTWKLENFDLVNNGDFEFKVTKNGVELAGSVITFDKATGKFITPAGATATASGGSYKLPIDPVTSSRQIKDEYAITLAVKNSLDSTWSYDSLYMRAYKSDALQILLDGQAKTTHTLSNIDRIKSMTSDQIVALNRDITLKNSLKINNENYDDLGTITDQIAWKSSQSDVATIYHSSGGYVANIEEFNISSYQPTQSFLLSGLETGKTTVTATHAQTGIKAEVDLTVETLKDKLYLFQFYPKTTTKISYTNNAGEDRSVTSNANGELALFDESGIASDVYVTSSYGGSTYTGVLSQDRLMTKEGNPAYVELYPINILQLRQLSKVEAFFKTPDGRPYTGKLTYRGGVYKNGNYAEATDISGNGVTTTLGADGRLEVIFDTTDFYSKAAGEKNAADLSAKDKIEFVLEVTFDGDKYLPQLMTYDGNTSPVDQISTGDKIVQIVANPSLQKSPLIVNQYVTSGQQTKQNEQSKTYITNFNGKFGPSNRFDHISLTTELMWWGETVDEQAYAELLNENGMIQQGQSYQTIKYPFSNTMITRHVQVLNKDTIWLDKAQSGSIHFRLYDKPDSFRKSLTASATLVNMIGVPEVSQSRLLDRVKELKDEMDDTNGSAGNPSNNDKIMMEVLGLLGNVKMDAGPLSMRVYPTEDPMVFKMIMSASLGNMPQTGGSGVDLNNSDNTFMPGAGDLLAIAQQKYLDDQRAQYKQLNKANHSSTSKSFSVGGYYIGEIKYNVKTDKWDVTVHGGGFNAGGGFEYSATWNMQAGFVPVTFSLTIGGGVEVGFRASVLFDELPGYEWSDPQAASVNDYLTSLRIIAYVEAFGGIGFDYSVIAAKIGVFGRVTVDNTSTWLSRDYLKKASDRTLYGNKLTLESIVGVRVVFKFLFVSVQHDFASLRYSHTWVFNNWKKIEDYWNENATVPITAANMEVAIASYMESIGEDPMQVITSQVLEGRSYLDEYERSWNKAITGSSGLQANGLVQSLAAAGTAPVVMQSNAYPFSNPQVAADGSLIVYHSDGGSTAIEDTVASWAIRSGSGYADQGEIVTDPALKGYGDTGLQVAGEGNRIAAVWVRQKDHITKDAGEELTNEDILLMNNSAEIMASIYDGSTWTTHQLTNNLNPDVAPVVSVDGGKVFVAYRSVYSSNLANPLDFSESDSIVYTVYDMASGQWSDAETVYNGTNGTVMGLSSEILGDGTAAVVYTVNKGNVNNVPADEYVAGSDNQIIYTVIDTDRNAAPAVQPTTWKTKGVVKNLQVTGNTNNKSANENPQLIGVKFADGIERFIIAWHTTSGEAGNVQRDIKLVAVNADGEVYSDFIDGLNALNVNNDIRIDPNFTFVKLPKAHKEIDKLSIIWKQTEVDTNGTQSVPRDALKAVKFGLDSNELFLSGLLDIGELPDNTALDTVDAYVSDRVGNEIRAVILGTTYTTDTEVVGTITEKQGGEAGGDAIPVAVSKTVSDLYTASATYQNGFNVDLVLFNPSEVVSGYDLPVQFQVMNQGLSKIKSVTIDINGQSTSYSDTPTGTMAKLPSLAPNSSQALIGYYNVPLQIEDVPYSVNVVFAGGEQLTTSGTLNLDIPSVGIAQVKTLKEEGGKRILSVPIYNKNGTTLSNNGRVLKFGLYTDNTWSNESLIGNVITISDPDDLKLADQGAYTHTVEFDVQAYLAAQGLAEIPERGINLYLHTWVEDANGDTVTEVETSDNDAKVMVDNLAVKYNNNNVLLTMEQTNSATQTGVELTMQNMNMAPVASGNVMLNLLDANGNVVETKYLVTTSGGLLSFSAEEKKTETVQFSQAGHSVQAVFFQQSADVLDATLSTVTLSGIALNFDPGQTVYSLQASDLKKTNLVAVASNSEATVSLLDGGGNVISTGTGSVAVEQSLLLSPNGALNEFTITVDPVSAAGTTMTYSLAITNTRSSKPQLELLVKGTKGADDRYAGDVDLALTSYDVEGFDIDHAEFKINDGDWQAANYDGTKEQRLTTVSEEGSYAVAAKVVLASGQTYELAPAKFDIMPAGVVVKIPDAAASSTTVSKTTVTADGKDQATVTVRLKDVDGTALSGRKVTLTADAGSSTITAVEDTTNAGGEASFTVKNTAVETVSYTAKDAASGVTLSPVQVSFVSEVIEPSPEPNPDSGTNPSPGTNPMPAPPTGSGTDSTTTPVIDPAPEPDNDLFMIFKKGLIASEELLRLIQERLQSTAALNPEESFTDIQNHWARQFIDLLVRLKVINGYSDGTFKPNNSITRAEFATMLARLITFVPTDAQPLSFEDVQEGYWAQASIDLLTSHGIIKGYTNGTFKPNDTITREEMTVMLMRLLEGTALPQTGNVDFEDSSLVAAYARDSVTMAAKAGIIQGNKNSINPKGNASRAEVATMLIRLLMLDPKLKEILES